MEALLVRDDYDYSAPGFKAVVEDDGVELQEALDSCAEFAEFMGVGEESEDGNELV